jgi:hypothetical protein
MNDKTDVRQRARELLATECDNNGWAAQANLLRNSLEALDEYNTYFSITHFNIALRAIEAALSSTAGVEAELPYRDEMTNGECADKLQSYLDAAKEHDPAQWPRAINPCIQRAIYCLRNPPFQRFIAENEMVQPRGHNGRGGNHECAATQPVAGDAVQELPGRDREALLYLMRQFDVESWECPKCGHSEDTASMDSADYLRKFLEGSRAASQRVPDEKYPDDGNGDDDAYNAGFNECRRLWIAAAPSPAAAAPVVDDASEKDS